VTPSTRMLLTRAMSWHGGGRRADFPRLPRALTIMMIQQQQAAGCDDIQTHRKGVLVASDF